MKVIFLQHVLHVAKQGEVKEVSAGYASNFLFPKNLAKPYTQNIEAQQKKNLQKKETERRQLLGNKQEMIDALSGQIFEFELPTQGETVLGSIAPKDIAAYIKQRYHFPLSKKHIDIREHHNNIKTLGDHEIYINLGNNFAGKAIVRIKKK